MIEILLDNDNVPQLKDDDILKIGADYAEMTMKLGEGGPFGAVITKNGKPIAIESNSVLKDHDPTAHAEVNAIRKAGQVLGVHDLSDCEMYATGYPCPMCLSAIIWSNIKTVHVSGLPKDAAQIGFRDEFMYEYLKKDIEKEDLIDFEFHDRSIAQKLYDSYQGQIY